MRVQLLEREGRELKVKIGLRRVVGVLMIVLGIFNICTSLLTIKTVKEEKQIRDRIEATIVDISEVRREDSRSSKYSSVYHFQDFNVTYEYDGYNYTVEYKDLQVVNGGFKEGDKEFIYVNKEHPEDIMLESYSGTSFLPVIICLVLVLVGTISVVSTLDFTSTRRRRIEIKIGLTRIIGLGMLLISTISLCGILVIVNRLDKEIQSRDKIEGTITEASEVWEELV